MTGTPPPEYYRAAASQLGYNETQQNAALKDYLSTGGQNIDPAARAWCADFVNASLQHGGLQGTGSGMARSFLNWGQGVDTPRIGDVAVVSSPARGPNAGHVGFYAGQGPGGRVRVLGGNQSDSVSYDTYSPDRLLGYRRPPEPGQGGGHTIDASQITGDPSAYQGGSIMPVSAVPPGQPVGAAPQAPTPPTAFGGIDQTAMMGLMGLGMVADAASGRGSGSIAGAIQMLAQMQQKTGKSAQDLKSRREIQYLVSLGYDAKDAAVMVHTGQKPAGVGGGKPLAERKFEFDVFKYHNPQTPKPTAEERLGAKLKPEGTLEEQIAAARTTGRVNPAEVAQQKAEVARQKAALKRVEKAKVYESALANVDRLMELALGKVDPSTGEVVEPGAFTGVDEGWWDRGVAGAGNLWDRMNRPKAGAGPDAPRRSHIYQDEMSRLLEEFTSVFGGKGTQSDKDIARHLVAMPQGDWYPDTEDDAREKLTALRKTIEEKMRIALSEGEATKTGYEYDDPAKEARFREWSKNPPGESQ